MDLLLKNWHAWLWSAVVIAGAIVVALGAHGVVYLLLRRLARHRKTVLAGSLVRHSQRMSKWILPLVALLLAVPEAKLPPAGRTAVEHVLGLGLIAAIAWLVILCTDVLVDLIAARHKVDVADNLEARRIHTQMGILHRIAVVIVIVITAGIMLMTFPTIKHIGMSLLASAGLAGLVVGVAMKGTLSSLIAGVQIALTQPIRIEDAVVVEGEWGWIEEIGATYVVIRIWDLRRLIVPLSYFIENPFQNWTRQSADLLGSVEICTDYSVPVEELRQEFQRILKSTDKWKGQVAVLQVTDASERTVKIRALMDARDGGTAWDLRCYVREKLIQFLQQKYPHALPRLRAEVEQLGSEGKQAARSSQLKAGEPGS
ncbi:MAG TPA: mechanosensitive ion channel domain-containing protein [Candidatus Acidoferrales bacterium]|nr:mechanosensitive ion channel domain-containing protein [Candidatus Acidoferrales bacterium]